MTFIVMCDGAPASLKAVGWAAVPGYLMRQHEGEQLILLHVWERGALPPPIPPDNAEGAVQAPEELGTVKRFSPFVAIHKTLETIMGSKATRDTLNYKFETMSLQETPPNTPRSVRASSALLHAGDLPRPSSRQRLSTRAGGSAKREAEQQSQSAAEQTSEELEAAARELAEETERRRASIIAQYASDRLKHHGAQALLLGVGNTVESKCVTIGHVSKAVLHKIRQTHPLWFIKSGGTTLRLNSTALRHVVVIVPHPGEEGALKRDCNVIQHTLGQCRKGSEDSVAAVVVAEGGISPEDVEVYTRTLEQMLQSQADRSKGKSVLPPDEDHRPPGEQVEGLPTGDGAAQTASDATVSIDPTTPEALGAHNQEAIQEEEWPLVSVCQLHATKQVTEPTAARVPMQVTKFLQQRKVDVVVIASTAVDELQFALLGMPKQHVLILPTPEPVALMTRVEPSPDPIKETSSV